MAINSYKFVLNSNRSTPERAELCKDIVVDEYVLKGAQNALKKCVLPDLLTVMHYALTTPSTNAEIHALRDEWLPVIQYLKDQQELKFDQPVKSWLDNYVVTFESESRTFEVHHTNIVNVFYNRTIGLSLGANGEDVTFYTDI